MPQPLLYSVEREFHHPIETMWTAWTEASALEAWYHPADLECLAGSTESQLTVGGLWACAVSVPEHNFAAYFFGIYSKIVTNELLEHTMHYTESADEFAEKDMSTPSHTVTIEFENRGQNTWVKFSQFGELPEGMAERAQAGMESYFDSLSAYLSEPTVDR